MVKSNRIITSIRDLLHKRKVDGVIFHKQANISWLIGGRSHINIAMESSVMSVIVTVNETVVVTSNIEKNRLLEEEIQIQVDRVETFPWFDPLKKEELIRKCTSGFLVKDEAELEEELKQLRTIHSANDKLSLEKLAQDTASAIEQTMFEIKKGDSEYDISAKLASNCLEREVESIVNLVAVDERALKWRHPLPTSKRIDNYVLVGLCGRRNGRIVSVSRLMHFGPVSQELQDRHKAVVTVDATLIHHTYPGKSYHELFNVMMDAYENVGYPDEWKHHHQGGLTGYATREQLLLKDDLSHVVEQGQIYAWNPSIAGVKSEDTILARPDGAEIISSTGQYPTVEVQIGNRTMKRPDILVRSWKG
ncbi:M24 family metallopeptidase [Radiobacillus kanasensis]|uniref:M24 family metallopeptidase n=1 Tax=Radiobacillus kanasensis TaxID=2844358 RepID=UPI001E52F898|nr:M24 family metallopeptidase [Radiobacillus kanasensis]UFT98760.1 M24 family metallopeptidase [Radiobacillus kanasensis]